jgi:hypothetical protein
MGKRRAAKIREPRLAHEACSSVCCQLSHARHGPERLRRNAMAEWAPAVCDVLATVEQRDRVSPATPTRSTGALDDSCRGARTRSKRGYRLSLGRSSAGASRLPRAARRAHRPLDRQVRVSDASLASAVALTPARPRRPGHGLLLCQAGHGNCGFELGPCPGVGVNRRHREEAVDVACEVSLEAA